MTTPERPDTSPDMSADTPYAVGGIIPKGSFFLEEIRTRTPDLTSPDTARTRVRTFALTQRPDLSGQHDTDSETDNTADTSRTAPDTVRTPEADMPEHPAGERVEPNVQLLVARLVAHHNVAPLKAIDAVDQHQRGATGPLTELITTETAAIHNDPMTGLAAVIKALIEIQRTAATAMGQLAAAVYALHEATANLPPVATARRDRPAWVSPYGPPRRRR